MAGFIGKRWYDWYTSGKIFYEQKPMTELWTHPLLGGSDIIKRQRCLEWCFCVSTSVTYGRILFCFNFATKILLDLVFFEGLNSTNFFFKFQQMRLRTCVAHWLNLYSKPIMLWRHLPVLEWTGSPVDNEVVCTAVPWIIRSQPRNNY